MRLTFAALGWSFDVSLEPTAADEDDQAAALNGGTLATQFVGFAVHATPEDIPLPQRTPACGAQAVAGYAR